MIRRLTILAALLLAAFAATAAGAQTVRRIGKVTWHPGLYAGKEVSVKGYLLRQEGGYAVFSDEPGGKLSRHDLPVTGKALDTLRPRQEYLLRGRFVKGGLVAVNGSPWHLELTAPPQPLRR